ncbi:MAG TPA: cobalt-precorrin-5B (C(1))-methyltransferase CbiD [Bacillota bacterium]|nr:cobalt-precorrin-5B (C(1))-methyltransferase CbiD [Bacillota bacterium]
MNELQKSRLRCGISTGATAAAAARAATLLLFHGDGRERVVVYNPDGLPLEVPVASLSGNGDEVRAVAVKDGGDDPDVTSGLEIVVDARRTESGIKITAGKGVGVVTRKGLPVTLNEPAINPVPRMMITAAVSDVIPAGEGIELTVSVPRGEEVAARTLNPRLGIIGGISILGTTGIVKPMSDEAFKKSLEPMVDVAVAAGCDRLVLTPGRIGSRFAVARYGFSAESVVETSNFIGYMLDVCTDRGVREVLLWGHHGKLVKVAAGVFHTHSRTADGRQEVIAAYAGAFGAGPEVIRRILETRSSEEALGLLKENGLTGVMDIIAARASARAEEYSRGRLKVGTVLLGLDGNILGCDETALKIGEEMGWKR